MATQVQNRRGTTAEHSTFTGAVGEVTIDTDKDTAVVHDGSTAGGRPLLREDLSNLPAGAIDNADINASAAIAGTKISPNFGSQNVTTTGTSTAASFIPTSSTVPTNGVYLPAANSVALSTNGTGRLFVDASGNVILGTTSILSGATGRTLQIGTTTDSASTLQFAATTTGNSYIQFGDGESPESYAGYLQYVHTDNALLFGTNKQERLRITSAGLVGIGASDPQRPLDVVSNSSAETVTFRGASANNISTLRFNSNNAATNYASIQSRPIFFELATASGVPLLLSPGSGTGVGIGTSLPLSILNVVDANVSGTDNIGNVYIRTTDAQAADVGGKLTLGGYYNATSHFAFAGFAGRKENSTNDNVAGYLQFLTSTSGGTLRETMRLDSSGRLGIGTTSPGAKLHVAGSTILGDDGTNGRFSVETNTSRIALLASTTGFGAYEDLEVYAAATIFHRASLGEAARIDSSGRLLVGTSTARTNYFNTTIGAPLVQFESTDAPRLSVISSSSVDGFPGQLILAHQQSGTTGGNTTVTSSSSLGMVSFQGSDGTEFVEAARIEVTTDGTPGANDMPGRLVFSTTADGASSPTERMRIGNDGRTSAFSASSTNTLTLSSAAAAGTTFKFIEGAYGATGVNTGTESFRVYTNGDVQNTNNSYGSISDIKLKENIVDANSQWDDIKALQVRNYNFKEGQTHTQIGLVAQEVELVSPGLVTESPDRDEDGNDLGTVTKSVNYSVLYMKAVKALQEAMERIELLEARLDAANL